MNRFKLVVLLCLVAFSGRTAHAGYVHYWTFRELAARAEVLATAEVVSVETVGRDASASPRYPQLKRRAQLRVLRAVAPRGQAAPVAGQTLTLDFETFDRANIHVYINTPPDYMPDVAPGQIRVFPLRRGAEPDAWRLIESSGVNLLTPALGANPPDVEPREASLPEYGFLRAELAGVFINGDDAEIFGAINRYFWGYGMGGSPLLNSFDLIEQKVQDEDRWLSIAASGLLATARTTPRVPLPQLLDAVKQKNWSSFQRLQSRMLHHLSRSGVERRLMNEVLAQAANNPYQASQMAALMLQEFADQPEARQQFEAGLKRDDPQWTRAVDELSGMQNPLKEVALSWARRHLAEQTVPQELWNICSVLRRLGSANDLAALEARIENARLKDKAHYKIWLRACTSDDWSGRGQSKRPLSLRVWSRLIDDQSEYQAGYKGWRWCDQATLEIGRSAGQNFGLQRWSSLAKRNQGVAKARAWLDKRARSSTQSLTPQTALKSSDCAQKCCAVFSTSRNLGGKAREPVHAGQMLSATPMNRFMQPDRPARWP